MSSPASSLERNLNIAATIISVVGLLIIGGMKKIHIDTDIDFGFLPPFYSSLNAICAICLIIAVRHIRNKRVEQHRKYMIVAMSICLVFLLCYVLYHITTPETLYCGEGIMRPIYFFFLITHIVLAAVSFPFILFTFVRGYLMKVEQHRKLARWVYPVWLYVCVTGPLCYLMLMPCYNN
ncbi:MAG: DUF420 domain-containing protein [Saprospiraceae bacterium]|nr:DUF420 domain-containing protein [Saprospiraceae bacterium]